MKVPKIKIEPQKAIYGFAMLAFGVTAALLIYPTIAAAATGIAVIAIAFFPVAVFILGFKLMPIPNFLGASPDEKIIKNMIDFTSVKLRDCMIPRTDIVAVEENATIEELKQKFVDTGVSKIIVYNEDIDQVSGYVHSKELFKNPPSVKSMIHVLTFVPETMSGNKMMQVFMQEHRSIAIVVDEYGGTSGLLTLEDLIEEIFGDIEDEHDKDNLIDRQISDNEYIFSGRLEIDYINETYNLNIPEKDDYDTIAGFILYHHLNLPLAGETINIEPYTFIIRKLTNTRIDLVQMSNNKSD